MLPFCVSQRRSANGTVSFNVVLGCWCCLLLLLLLPFCWRVCWPLALLAEPRSDCRSICSLSRQDSSSSILGDRGSDLSTICIWSLMSSKRSIMGSSWCCWCPCIISHWLVAVLWLDWPVSRWPSPLVADCQPPSSSATSRSATKEEGAESIEMSSEMFTPIDYQRIHERDDHRRFAWQENRDREITKRMAREGWRARDRPKKRRNQEKRGSFPD